jgi:hypothetical protein
MPLSTDQLRELLAERSDAADLHPAPQECLSMRIRRARIRRATVAGLLAVVAAAGVLTGLHLSHDHAASAVPVSGQQFPVSFTASDGTLYRRMAVTTSWQFAVYEWIPPAVARPAPAVPRLPGSYTGYNTTTGVGMTRLSLIASRSGTWPADLTVTITVPDHGRNFAISLACSGDIAGRLQVSVLDRGQLTDQVACASWTPGQQPTGQISFGGRAGVPDTMTFRIQAPSSYWAAAYAKRPASWTIAIYTEGA